MKKMIFFSALILIFLLIFYTLQSGLKKQEVYTILNDIFRDDSTRVYELCAKPNEIDFSGEWKKDFTWYDRTFASLQKVKFAGFRFEKGKLSGYYPRVEKFEPIPVYDSCNVKYQSVTRISFPLISADRSKVVIEIEDDCNCMLGGQAGKYLFVKKNGRWKRSKSYDYWISQNKRNKELLLTKGR